MKKILAVILTVCLFATLCATTAFAVDSRQGKPEYDVDVISYDSGSPTKGDYTTEGETVILTARGGDTAFIGRNIVGEYEVVEGDINSRRVVIRPKSSLKIEEMYAFPGSKGEGKATKKIISGGAERKITVYAIEDDIIVSGLKDIEMLDDGTVRMTATDPDFSGWAINGKYELVSGSLKDKVIVFRPLDDVKVFENGKRVIGTGDDPTVIERNGERNNSSDSPKTGNTALALVLAVIALSFATVLYTKKSIAE